MGMRVLSIDGATQRTGWCILDKDTKEIIKYGCIVKTSDEEPNMLFRIIYMIDSIKEILETNHIDEIVQEEVPPAINNSSTVLALGTLKGGILGLAHSKDLFVNYITVPYWHSQLGIKKANGDLKKQSIEWVNNKYGLDLIYKSPNSKLNQDNEADSIAFGSVWIENYNKKEKKGFERKKR